MQVICSLFLQFTYLWDKITSNWGSKMDASTLETHNRVNIFMKFIWKLSLWFQYLKDWKISWGCKNSNAPSNWVKLIVRHLLESESLLIYLVLESICQNVNMQKSFVCSNPYIQPQTKPKERIRKRSVHVVFI